MGEEEKTAGGGFVAFVGGGMKRFHFFNLFFSI